MQIVIEIPDDNIPTKQCYKDVLIKFVDKQVCGITLISQDHSDFEKELFFEVLPEGHGDLVDRSQALRTDCFGDGHDGLRAFHEYGDYAKMRKYLQHIPTIIPADKEGEENENNTCTG